MNKKHNENMSAIRFYETLWERVLRCGRVYYKLRHKNVHIEGLYHSIGFSMSTSWGQQRGPLTETSTRRYLYF